MSPAQDTITRPRLTVLSDGWRQSAACLRVDPGLFFEPDGGEPEADATVRIAAARAVCDSCPVRSACLVDATRTGDKYAIRAGLLPGERDAKARRERPRVAPKGTDDASRVIDLVKLGLNGKQVSKRTGIPVHTVRRHIRSAKADGRLPLPVMAPPTSDPRCGSYAGWQAHQRRNEGRCDACRAAATEYDRNRKARTAA